MSKIALEGNASGTGTFTVAAPNSNSNYTITLPQETGTLITTGVTSGISGSAITTGTVGTTVGGTGLNSFTSGGAMYASSTSALTTGTLPVASGGTGATSLTSNNVLLGNGTSAVQFVAPGANGNVLTSNGTTWTSATPSSSIPTTTGDVGTYALMRFTNNTIAVPGSDHVAGTLLAFSNCSGVITGNAGNPYYASGTWRLMGDVPSSGTAAVKTSVMLRIA